MSGSDRDTREEQERAALENIVNRYDRQELIEGWDQRRLTGAKVAVVGTDILSHFTSISLAALGFGDIEVYGPGFVDETIMRNHTRDSHAPDYSPGFLYFDARVRDAKAEVIANFLTRLNPRIASHGINIDLCRAGNINIIGSPDIIFDTTNDPASKFAVIEYASAHQVPVVSLSSSHIASGAGVYDPRSRRRDKKRLVENIVFAEFNGAKQGTTSSQIISALAVDEARKYLMPLRNEEIIQDTVLYNLRSNKRFDLSEDRDITRPQDLEGKTVLMVGAGALGNFTGLDMVLNNVGHLYIVDFDEVESTNLNRQVWFYESVGENKAKALVDKLKLINPRVKLSYIQAPIEPGTEPFFENTPLDLMMDTVDNNKTRALLNYISLRTGIPFISGGTSYNSGQATIAIPGTTACLNCQADIDQLALNAYQPHQSCIYAPQASVITSNQIIAGFIGGEAKTVLRPDAYSPPIHAVLKYVSGEKFRFAALPAQAECECHLDTETLDRWYEKMGHLYDGEFR